MTDQTEPTADVVKCTGCGAAVGPLELFPRNRCLSCHARAYDTAVNLGAYRPTADGIARMWGAS